MKKSTKFLLPIAVLLMGFASCTPEETETPEPEQPQTVTPTAPTPPTPTVTGTWGALVAIKMNLTYSQMGFDVNVETQMGVGAFYNNINSGTLVDAGTIQLNNNTLEKQTNNSYTKMATMGMTPSDLGIGSGVSWSVSGGSGIPSFNYTHTGAFPNFTGTIPTTINRADGLTLTLNNTTVSGADSVYVFFVSGSTTLLKSYGANAGPITIDATDLNTLTASSTTSPAYVEVIPWKYVIENVGSPAKSVAFIKENAIVKSLTLN